MSNLNDFLGPVYKTKNVTTTTTLSSDFSMPMFTENGGTEITPLQTTISNVHNNSIIIRVSCDIIYGNYDRLTFFCFRNNMPALESFSTNSDWDTNIHPDLIFARTTSHKNDSIAKNIDFTVIDTNPGTSPTYKFTHMRGAGNGAVLKSGGTVSFTTNPLYDLTA